VRSGQRPSPGRRRHARSGPARSVAAVPGNGVSFWDTVLRAGPRRLLPDAAPPGGTVLRSTTRRARRRDASRDDNAPPGGTRRTCCRQPADALTLHYEVRSNRASSSSRGGKLPACSAVRRQRGEHRGERLLHAVLVARPAGRRGVRVPAGAGGYGDSLGRGRGLPHGEWNEIAQRVELNSPGRRRTVAVTLNGSGCSAVRADLPERPDCTSTACSSDVLRPARTRPGPARPTSTRTSQGCTDRGVTRLRPCRRTAQVGRSQVDAVHQTCSSVSTTFDSATEGCSPANAAPITRALSGSG